MFQLAVHVIREVSPVAVHAGEYGIAVFNGGSF